MKRTLLAFLLLFASVAAYAGDGYRIKLKFTDYKDSFVYLAHYFAKPLPTIYKADSAKVDKNGYAVLQSKEKVLGGIYIILMENKNGYFEFLLNNGDDMSITATMKSSPVVTKFTNSPENDRFNKYMTYLVDFSTRNQKLEEEMKTAKTKADTTAVYAKGKALGEELENYRLNVIKQSPGSLLANIFKAMAEPKVPQGNHLLPDGTVDSNFAYNYFKNNYWKDFDFNDDRLIHTPIYDGKLDEYFNKLVLPVPDSVEKEANELLKKTRGRKELFKYTLHWVTQWAQNSKVMGMDEVFVYMVENYYMKGDAYWLDDETLKKYIDRAQKVAPNVIGNLAPELNMTSIDGKPSKLSSVNAKYTLLIFWAPDCGHCQTEMPLIDSAYKAELKGKGVKIYAVKVGDEEQQWKDYIKKHNLNEWMHVHNPEHTSNYKADYDVYGTPSIYLLDERKIIRGKKLDHSNIGTVIEMLEKKEAATKTGSK